MPPLSIQARIARAHAESRATRLASVLPPASARLGDGGPRGAASRATGKPAGVDFAEISRRSYEAATPEARARIDAARAREARADATASTLPASFERLEFGPGKDARGFRETRVESRWEKDVGIRIEEVGDREVVRFTGAVTGHESYTLDGRFCAMLVDPDENRARPRFYLCAGTPGRWDACSVDPADVAAYLMERRPELFPDTGPAPGM